MPANPTTIRCPCCGRPRTPRAKPIRPAPLLDWIERHQAAERGGRPVTTGARLMLRYDLRDAAGEPRACIVIPGRRLPLAFPSIPAALAALANMKAVPHGR
jgi:hypothetical protein